MQALHHHLNSYTCVCRSHCRPGSCCCAACRNQHQTQHTQRLDTDHAVTNTSFGCQRPHQTTDSRDAAHGSPVVLQAHIRPCCCITATCTIRQPAVAWCCPARSQCSSESCQPPFLPAVASKANGSHPTDERASLAPPLSQLGTAARGCCPALTMPVVLVATVWPSTFAYNVFLK
ncbi:hypothetical protein COO60DRAFT_658874 [Scenedesmus sp. NREL 46B-D3]|nr:hypothetical protein COO60DRAFT_658874 [Scenedesmus sp. NREL 46B-D3]